MHEATAPESGALSDEETILLQLRPAAGGLEALGLLVALMVPVSTLVALALFEPSFASWRPAIAPLLAATGLCATAVGARWRVAQMRARGRMLQLSDRALIWLESSRPSRRARRADLGFRYRREPIGDGEAQRWHPRYELMGEDVAGLPVHVELTQWSAPGRRPDGEELAQRVAGWIERGDLEHADTSATLTWNRPEEDAQDSPPAGGLAAAAPRWMRLSWYLLGLGSPIVSWLWLRERVGATGDPSIERALASFFLLFLSLLILQPVIAQVMRTRLEMALALLGPALALGLPRLLGPGAVLDDGAGTATWMLWLVDMGTVHIVTVYLAFAVVAYVASFTTGAARAWDRMMFSAFALRSGAALVFFVPALLYGRLLVDETLEVLEAGPWWMLLAWLLALLSETGTVVRRMLRSAAL